MDGCWTQQDAEGPPSHERPPRSGLYCASADEVNIDFNQETTRYLVSADKNEMKITASNLGELAKTTYPRLGPLGTRNGATTPTRPHNVVKQIIGRAME